MAHKGHGETKCCFWHSCTSLKWQTHSIFHGPGDNSSSGIIQIENNRLLKLKLLIQLHLLVFSLRIVSKVHIHWTGGWMHQAGENSSIHLSLDFQEKHSLVLAPIIPSNACWPYSFLMNSYFFHNIQWFFCEELKE